MAVAKRQRNGRKREKGQSVIELTASIIMFVIMMGLVFSISAYLYVQHAMVSAAREGARNASLNTEIGDEDTTQEGVDAVEAYVVEAVQSMTGLDMENENVTVTPPDAGEAVGERMVTVQINYNMENPLPIAGFLQAFGASGEGLDAFPITAVATMRYEE